MCDKINRKVSELEYYVRLKMKITVIMFWGLILINRRMFLVTKKWSFCEKSMYFMCCAVRSWLFESTEQKYKQMWATYKLN
jgi:hypothetical protein